MKKLAVILISMSISAVSHAYSYGGGGGDGSGFMFNFSLMRVDGTTNYSGQSATDTQINHMLTEAGYTLTNGFYFGLTYESSAKYFNATGTPTPETRISYGPTIGYHNSGWFIDGTYFVASTDTMSGGGYFSSGSGYMLELGYHYAVTSNFYIGVSLVYDGLSYTQYTFASTTISQSNSQTDYYPAFNIGVNF